MFWPAGVDFPTFQGVANFLALENPSRKDRQRQTDPFEPALVGKFSIQQSGSVGLEAGWQGSREADSTRAHCRSEFEREDPRRGLWRPIHLLKRQLEPSYIPA